MSEPQSDAAGNPSGWVREVVIAAVPIALGSLALTFLPEGSRLATGFPSPDSPAFFPTLISLLLIGMGLALLAQVKTSIRLAQAGYEPVTLRPIVITLALFLFYWFALSPAGFVVSSAVVIIGLGFAFGERITWRVLVFSIAFPVVIDIIFRKAANVWLPQAPWG